MSLPTLPSGNKKENNGGDVDKSQFSLPDLELPDLDELEPLKDLSNEVAESEGLDEIEDFEGQQDNQSEPDDLANEEIEDDEDFEDIGDELQDDFEDGGDDDEDFVDLSEEDDLDDEEFLEEDLEENFSFLPTVDLDDEDEDEYEEFSDEDSNDSKENKGFKELDDESVKEFFNNLKAKILGLVNKDKKDEEPEQPKPAGKISKKSSIKKVVNGKNLTYLLISAAVIAIIVFLFSLIGSGYKPLNELSAEASGEDTEILLQNFRKDGDLVYFDVINQGDMSADFFMEAEFTESTGLFSSENYSCRSDIISLETHRQAEEFLRCENFDADSEYKVDIEIVEIR